MVQPMKGGYVLLVRLPEEQTITVGGLGDVHFPQGQYAYIGSAMGGLKARLSHHLHRSRRPHWHIDYFLGKAVITGIILSESEQRIECAIAQALEKRFDSIPGFGSSDCRCRSHLFFSPEENGMKRVVMASLNQLGFPTGL